MRFRSYLAITTVSAVVCVTAVMATLSTGATAVSGGTWGGCSGLTTLAYHDGTFIKNRYHNTSSGARVLLTDYAVGDWHSQLNGSACGPLEGGGTQWGSPNTDKHGWQWLWRRKSDGTTEKRGPYALWHDGSGHKCFRRGCMTYGTDDRDEQADGKLYLNFWPATRT